MDDGFNRLQSIIADLSVFQFLRDTRHHADDARKGAHLLDGLHLFQEVVQRELTVHETLGGLLGALLIEGFFGLVDEGEHVAHAEDALSHAVGVELFECVELLASTRKRNRLTNDFLDGKGRPTAGITIEL